MKNKEALKNIKLFLFDMDGTLYIGDRLFDFTKELLRVLRKTGRQYLFTTNNSSKSPADYVKKLARLGIEAREEDFYTSSQAMAHYLKEHHPGKVLYVCGTESLKAQLRKEGFEITEDTERVECIVMGFDTELTFQKLEDVSRMLCLREIPYLATNPDLVCPTEFGSVPDCGSVCKMIENATGKTPVVIGKPEALMMDLARQKMGMKKDETAVVGDRIYTDIKSGLNAGILSILVMSGETDEAILAASPDKPDLILRDAREILDVFLG
ncbi:MAG: HAD-IIA family hydrolase [Clostridia bacterium]|nr:HAD-IIA family hydrolase [Clostridia bacterium]